MDISLSIYIQDARKSRVINRTLSPEWEEQLELVGPAAEMKGALLHVEVFDKDKGVLDKDDKLGSASVDIGSAGAGAPPVEFSVPLDTKGTVHFSVETFVTQVGSGALTAALDSMCVCVC